MPSRNKLCFLMLMLCAFMPAGLALAEEPELIFPPQEPAAIEAEAFVDEEEEIEIVAPPEELPEVIPAPELPGEYALENGVLTAWNGDTAEARLPEGVRVIAAGAFRDDHIVQTVICPASLERIEAGAFVHCTALGRIVLMGPAEVSEGAFAGCDPVVEIPSALRSRGAIVVLRQPEDITVAAGRKGTIRVEAYGSDLSYQWQILDPGWTKWLNASGALAAQPAMTFTMRKEWDGRQYRCVITDGEGSVVKTKRMTLHVVDIPVPEAPAQVAMKASGTSIQVSWSAVEHAAEYAVLVSEDGKLSDAARTTTGERSVTLTGLKYGTTYTVWVVASNIAGESDPSGLQALKLTAPPVIRTQPQDLTAAAGQKATIQVSAWGENLSYQWQIMNAGESRWLNATGEIARQPSMTMTMRKEWNGRQYRCVIRDSIGNEVKSCRMTLTVVDAPAPEAPGPLSFRADGTRLQVSWAVVPYAERYTVYLSDTNHEEDAVAAARATGNQAVLEDLCYGTAYGVWVSAANAMGEGPRSEKQSFTLHTPPRIDTQPKSLTVRNGEKGTVSVAATGTGLTYRWQWADPAADRWYDAGGELAAQSSMTMTMRLAWNGRRYRCVVGDDIGNEVISEEAVLTVTNEPGVPAITGVVQLSDSSARVDWSAAVNAESYLLYCGASFRMSEAEIMSVTSGTNAVLTGLEPNKDYYIWVRAKNETGISTQNTAYRRLRLGGRPPVITQQPGDISCLHGQTVSITLRTYVENEYRGLCDYRWQVLDPAVGKWQDAAGTGGEMKVLHPTEIIHEDFWDEMLVDSTKSIGSTWTITAREEMNGFQYRCILTDNNGYRITSMRMTLHVQYALKVTKQPESASVSAGYARSFSIEATGDGLTYQWQWRRHTESGWTDGTGAGAQTASWSFASTGNMAGSLIWVRCRVCDERGNTAYSDAACLQVGAVSRVVDDFAFSYALYEGEPAWTVDSYRGSAASVRIPAQVDGLPVRRLGATFEKREFLQNVQIPDSVRLVGSDAFSKCPNLAQVDLGNGVQRIGAYAFKNCTALTTLRFPASLRTIENNAFQGCSALTDVGFSNGLETLGTSAFQDCTGLASLTLPPSLKTLRATAFEGCAGLARVTLPAGLETLDATAFDGCPALVSIDIAPGGGALTRIGGLLCNADTKTVLLAPKYLGLTACTIPEGMENIGAKAFFGYETLTSLSMPDSVVRIGHDAFAQCTSLRSVRLSQGLSAIPSQGFKGCRSLTAIAIPQGVQSISSGAFENCSALTSVTIPDGVLSIGDSAFRGCESLAGIRLPQSLKTVSARMFMGAGLTSVTIPSGVTKIEASAFADCTQLTDLTIPAGVTTIAEDAIAPNDGLTIHGDDYSKAYYYAARNGIRFEAL